LTVDHHRRRLAARERSAAAHERAAAVHRTAAAFFEANHRAEQAARELSAAMEAEGVARVTREQGVGQPPDEDMHTSLVRLTAIHTRLHVARARTLELDVRARQAIDRALASQRGAVARVRITELRRDLDDALHEIAGLRAAMQTRGVIEQAKGMLMLRLGVSADDAFRILVQQAQHSGIRVSKVASEIVEHCPIDNGQRRPRQWPSTARPSSAPPSPRASA
jgi:hypothetical protein